MAKYNTKSTQAPFKPGFKTDKVEIEAITNTANQIISFAITTKKGKKEQLKNFTVKSGKIQKAWDELDVGGVMINEVPSWRADQMPYGGSKDSGLGREGSSEGILEFLEEIQFDRVGAFTYSPQEGTRAAAMHDDVPDALKRERLERLTELQRSITADRYESRLGKVHRLIVDRIDESGNAVGRLPWQADDIDGVTFIDERVAPGEFADVATQEVVDDYDFRATVVRRIISAPVTSPLTGRRALPLATMGSYGR